MSKCPNCNKEFFDNSNFCDVCGVRIEDTPVCVADNYYQAATDKKKNKSLKIIIGIVSTLILIGALVAGAIFLFNAKNDKDSAKTSQSKTETETTSVSSESSGSTNSASVENTRKKEAFKSASIAYSNILSAFESTDNYAKDIQDAWHTAIWTSDELTTYGVSFLAQETSMSVNEIELAILDILEEMFEDEFDLITYTYMLDVESELFFQVFAETDNISWFCVEIVEKVYEAKGETAKVEIALTTAQDEIKKLSEIDSDYEHYENLKGFYSEVKAYYDSCVDIHCSCEQFTQYVADYNKDAQVYKSSLDYFFEDKTETTTKKDEDYIEDESVYFNSNGIDI